MYDSNGKSLIPSSGNCYRLVEAFGSMVTRQPALASDRARAGVFRLRLQAGRMPNRAGCGEAACRRRRGCVPGMAWLPSGGGVATNKVPGMSKGVEP